MKQKSILALCAAPATRQSAIAFAVALSALFASPSAHAADITWSGTTADINTATNWVGGVLPINTATADRWVFGAAGAGGTALTGARAFGGMLFNAGAPAYTIGTLGNNSTWQVTSTAITNSSSNIQTINYNLAMAAARSFTGSTVGGDIIVNGNLTGGGNIGKTGTNNLTLTSAASTLSNNINVSGGGTLTFGVTGTTGAKNTGVGNFSITNATLAATPGVVTSGGNSSISRLSMNDGSKFTMADGVFNTFAVTGAAALANAAGTAPIFTFNLGGTSSTDVLAFTGTPTFVNAIPKINITPVSALTVGNSYTVVTAAAGLDVANSFVLGTGFATLGNTTYTLSITNTATATTIGVTAADLAKAYYSGAQGTTLNAGTPGVSSNWLDAESGGADTLVQPSAASEMHFTASGATNTTIATLGQDYTVASLNFNNTAGSVSINDTASNKINVGTLGINVTGGSHAINVPLVLSASQTFTNSGAGLLTIGGNINSNNKILTTSGAADITISGNISNSAGLVKEGNGTLTIAGNLDGSGGITKNGNGLLILNGSNILSGITVINQGTISVSSFSALGTDTTPIGMGGTGAAGITYTGTGEITARNIATSGALASSATITQSGTGLLKLTGNFTAATLNNRNLIFDGSTAGTGEFAGIISDASPTLFTQVNKNGSGTWTLSGANTYSNSTKVNAGTLALPNNLSIQNSPLDTSGLGLVDITGATTPTFGGLSGASNLTAVISYGSVTALTLNPKASTTTSYSGVIADGAAGMTLTKTGLGTQILYGTNTYTGVTQINAGILAFGNKAAKTSALATAAAAGSVGLGVHATDAAYYSAAEVGSLFNATLAGFSMDAASGVAIDTTFAGADFDQSVALTAARSLTKLGTGTLNLTQANTYSGTTTVNAGILSLDNSLAMQNSALNTTSSIAGTATAGLKTAMTTLTLGGLTGNKNLGAVFTTTSGGYSGVTDLTLNPGTGASPSYGAIIANGAIDMTLTKTGAGTQTLTGANTYKGTTTVSDGTLLINGASPAATGAVNINTPGILGGNGTFGGFLTVSLGATLAPGAASATVGTLTAAAGASVEGTYTCDVDGATADRLAVTGTVSLSGPLTVNLLGVGFTQSSYIIAQGTTLSGTFSSVPAGYAVTYNTTQAILSQVSSDPYVAWIESFTPNGLLPNAASKLPTADPDADGINNLLEFVLTGSPVVSSQSINPTLSAVGSDQVLSYKRSDASEAPTTTQIGQWSTDLATWTPVTPVVVNENGTAADDMTITVPNSNAVAGKLFLRLNVVK